MYKLLPPLEVNKIRKEYALRRISVILGLIAGAIIFADATLAPSLIFATKKKEASLYVLSSVRGTSTKIDREKLEVWVEKTKKELLAIAPDGNEDKPYEYFQKVLLKKSSGVSLSSFSWMRQTNNSKSLRIYGVADTRQSLLAFQSELNSSQDWSQVDLPVCTIAREFDISFEISLVPQKTK